MKIGQLNNIENIPNTIESTGQNIGNETADSQEPCFINGMEMSNEKYLLVKNRLLKTLSDQEIGILEEKEGNMVIDLEKLTDQEVFKKISKTNYFF